MSGILGGFNLPPGLRGYVAAEQQGQQRQMQELGMLAQMASLQGAAQDRDARAQMQPLQLEQLRGTIANNKLKAEQEVELRRIRGQLFSPQSPVSGVLGQGAAQGEVGPTLGNAQRLAAAPTGGMLSPNPQAIQQFIAAGGNPKEIEGIQKLGPRGQMANVNPKDFTPESFAAFLQSDNPAALRPRTKVELSPGGVAYDPFTTPVGTSFQDPNKAFSMGPSGPIPNLPFQNFEFGKARAGKTDITLNTDKTLFGGVASGVAGNITAASDQARAALGTLNTVGQIRTALDSGKVIAGPGTTARMFIGQIGQVLGTAGANETETLTKTRGAIQGLAQLELDAAQQMKGQGQITEAERSIIRRAASGDIDGMTVRELRVLTDTLDKTARFKIRTNARNVETLRKNPASASMVPFMEVAEPEAYNGGFKIIGKE